MYEPSLEPWLNFSTKAHSCLMLLRNLETQPDCAIHFSQHPAYHNCGRLESSHALTTTEVTEWQLLDELVRQEDVLEEVFTAPGTTAASSHPLEPCLSLSICCSLLCSPRLSVSLIRKGPGPISLPQCRCRPNAPYRISDCWLHSALWSRNCARSI